MIRAKRKSIYCYDFNTGKYLKEFDGIWLSARSLKDSFYIRYRMDKNKPLNVNIDNINYRILFKSNKTSNDNE